MAKKTAPKKKKAAKAPVRRAAARKASDTRAVNKSRAKAAGKKAAHTRAVKKSAARAAAKKAALARAVKRSRRSAAAARAAATKARKAAARRAVRRAATRPSESPKKAARPARRIANAAAPVAKTRPAATRKTAPPMPAAAPKKAAKPVRKPPALDRERRTVAEREMVPMPPSSLVPGHASAARSGADELRVKLATHTGSGPVLTAGDVDADWGAAEAVGDEAPGGDNPTPDQDVVDEIGRALGVEYDDDEELQGGDEIAGRDRDRWELDPASSDDFDER